jgi:hypothetical protein
MSEDAAKTILSEGKWLNVVQDDRDVHGETFTDHVRFSPAELRELAAEAIAAAELIEARAAVRRIT